MARRWKSRGIVSLAVVSLSICVPATLASAQVFVGPTMAGIINVMGPVAIGNIINGPVVVSGGSGLVPIATPIG